MLLWKKKSVLPAVPELWAVSGPTNHSLACTSIFTAKTTQSWGAAPSSPPPAVFSISQWVVVITHTIKLQLLAWFPESYVTVFPNSLTFHYYWGQFQCASVTASHRVSLTMFGAFIVQLNPKSQKEKQILEVKPHTLWATSRGACTIGSTWTQHLRSGRILQQLESWHQTYRKKPFRFQSFLHFRIIDKGLWVFSTRESKKR